MTVLFDSHTKLLSDPGFRLCVAISHWLWSLLLYKSSWCSQALESLVCRSQDCISLFFYLRWCDFVLLASSNQNHWEGDLQSSVKHPEWEDLPPLSWRLCFSTGKKLFVLSRWVESFCFKWRSLSILGSCSWVREGWSIQFESEAAAVMQSLYQSTHNWKGRMSKLHIEKCQPGFEQVPSHTVKWIGQPLHHLQTHNCNFLICHQKNDTPLFPLSNILSAFMWGTEWPKRTSENSSKMKV